MSHQTVLVVDFGGQYSQLIVRRVREQGVYSEMVPWMRAEAAIREIRPDAVILSGGPRSVFDAHAPTLNFEALDGIPTLGICYGMQLMAHALGGKVEAVADSEYGLRELIVDDAMSLVGQSLASHRVWMSHGTQVVAPPAGFTVTSHTTSCPVASIDDPAKQWFGVQFHPEVTHTDDGKEVLRRFLFDHAGLKGDWSMRRFVDESIERIRESVGTKGKVMCAVSGGVDSSVLAALLIRAVGDRAVCVFVDHGLLRKGEAEEVVATFRDHFHGNLKLFTEHDRFFGALQGLTDPELKRKAVGAEFVNVFDAHATELEDCDFLAQGTIYPDVVESGSETAAKIKSHHNVGGMPDWFKAKRTILEPLRYLFKDEVRGLGRELGLPAGMIEREPFPGPGLSVRITGEVTPERVRIVQDADAIFRSELRDRGLHKGIWQSYAALLDVRSVGVMGDERTYQQPIVLRAVSSEDAMTARAVDLPFEALEAIATRIVNEVSGVNRVFFDLTSKPPATIELE